MQAKDIKAIVVDDDDHVRRTVTLLFQLAAIPATNIREATNGAEALELLRQASADIVWTDTDMPHMNGLEMISRIRADENLRHIKIVMTSGYDRTADAQIAGADCFIQKPFRGAVLRKTITELLGIDNAAPSANNPVMPPPEKGDSGDFPPYPLAH